MKVWSAYIPWSRIARWKLESVSAGSAIRDVLSEGRDLAEVVHGYVCERPFCECVYWLGVLSSCGSFHVLGMSQLGRDPCMDLF